MINTNVVARTWLVGKNTMSGTKTLSEEQKRLLGELAQGANKVLENAEALNKEAGVLRARGALSRALFLHQISMEECGKAEMLGVWATGVLMGHEINATKLAAKLASHKSKNYTNAYMLPRNNEETEALQRGDFTGSTEAFSKQQAQFHEESNTAKNASLYVDFEDDKFVSPTERITEQMVDDMSMINSGFLQLMRPKVEMLSRWQENPDKIAVITAGFEAKLQELRSKYRDDPVRAFSLFVKEVFNDLEPPADDATADQAS